MPDLDARLPAPERPLRLATAELQAAKGLVMQLDAHFPGELVLGVSIDAVAALATTPSQRRLVARIRQLRPEDLGVTTPPITAIGMAPEPAATVAATISIDALLGADAAAVRALAVRGSTIRLTGQFYLSQREDGPAPMRSILVATAALEALVAMQHALVAAIQHPVLVVSQHRSRGHQLAVILREVVAEQGDLATVLRGVALPGYSEHQDLASPAFDLAAADGRIGDNFRHSAEYAWLRANADRFGFALSYPDGNTTGIKSEPWHWRYVGKTA